MANNGYVGKISNSGTMNVKAPNQTTSTKTGTVKTGDDMRNGNK